MALSEPVVDESVTARPAGHVREVVAAYQGYRQRNVAPAVHTGLPSPYLTLIFTLDEPLRIAQHVDPRRPGAQYDTLAGGLHTSPARIAHDGAQSGIQLLVSPLAARPLFGVPASAIAGYDGDAAELLGPDAAWISERLRDASSWPARFSVLDDALAEILARQPDRTAVPSEVGEAWRMLRASGGRVPIAAVADAIGYSDRHLTNRFRGELGLTPKAAARVIRFDRARRTLQRQLATGPACIGAVAADCGYFDQSHLVRDFVQYVGRSPSRWLGEECGNFQAGGVTDLAYFDP